MREAAHYIFMEMSVQLEKEPELEGVVVELLAQVLMAIAVDLLHIGLLPVVITVQGEALEGEETAWEAVQVQAAALEMP